MFSPLRRALLLVIPLLIWGCQSATDKPTVVTSEPVGEAPADGPTFLETNSRAAPRSIDPETFNFSGSGRLSWPDGRIQSGVWRDGALHGRGEETLPNGSSYSGEWAAGKRHGLGRQVYANGDLYEGTWAADVRSGNGEFTSTGGTVYQGEWQNDERHGQGVQADQRGRMYDGQWASDQAHGYGSVVYPNRVRYEGMWEAGQRSGFGKERRPDGSVYEGDWANDRPNGSGKETYPDGSAHEGEWADGYVLGHGTRTRPTGTSFTGAWVGDRISQGLVTFPDGTTYAGAIFKNGGRTVAADFLAFLEDNARLGNPSAEYLLAIAHLDYTEPAPDLLTAKHWLTRSADHELPAALYRLASLDWTNDWSSAKPRLERAAELGHPAANTRLGQYHAIGHHYPKNHEVAVSFYEQGANRGDLQAINNLAWLLATSSTNVADPQRATRMLEPLVLYLASWQLLDTYAAAQARLGRFELAGSLQERAIAEAELSGETDLLDQLEAMRIRLDMYANEEPFIE